MIAMGFSRQARDEAGLSLRKAAEMLGVDVTTIWRIEKGHTKRLNHDLVERMKALYAEQKTLRTKYVAS